MVLRRCTGVILWERVELWSIVGTMLDLDDLELKRYPNLSAIWYSNNVNLNPIIFFQNNRRFLT